MLGDDVYVSVVGGIQIDEPAADLAVDEEISIGDYVLTGGELPAMVLIEALSRQIPGVVGQAASVEQDSFREGLLDHPHYTRPRVCEGLEVPEVLLSGDHAAIDRWREAVRENEREAERQAGDLLRRRILDPLLPVILRGFLLDLGEEPPA